MTAVLTEAGPVDVTRLPGPDSGAPEALWVDAADAARATGWTLKPEGMCRDDVCVPLPATATRPGAPGVPGAVDLAAFWRLLGHPVVADSAGTAWALGTGAAARRDALASLAAPDFTLPDLAGAPHRLSDLRGRKIFLVSWAPW